MLRTALDGMYLCSLVLLFLGGAVFGAGAVMNTFHKFPTKLISKVLLSDPARLWLHRSHSSVKHIEILEVRGLFKKIVKCPQRKPDEVMMMIVDNRKKKSVSLGKGRKIKYNGQTKLEKGRKKKMIITNRKAKSTARMKILNGPSVKKENNKFVERHFRMTRRSKRPNRRLLSPKHRKPEVMVDQEEEKMYNEVKRKTPKLKRIELFPRSKRNKEQRKRKVPGGREKFPNKALGGAGLLIPVSLNEVRDLELEYSADGAVLYKEATAINNKLSVLNNNADAITKKQSIENVDVISTVVTSTFDEFKGSDPLTHATTTRTGIISPQEYNVMSMELNKSNNDLESSGSSLKTTTVMPGIFIQDEKMSNKVTLSINGTKKDDNTPKTQPNRPMTPSWNDNILEPTEALPRSTKIFDSLIKLYPEFQPDESNTFGDQINNLLSNNSVLPVESSGDSEVQVELIYKNKTLQVTEKAYVWSTDPTPPYPTGQKDSNITNTVTNGNEEIQDSVLSPLEMVMNYGSETTYCKPGYKYYAGSCRSMCSMGDFTCKNGGQCVIVENLGPMCRCHQTNNLCYRGECCRLSLTPFQLICVIGSCCIFVSVFLGSISLLIRRMDIKPVSKSVRTRLWISTLMPDSKSSSFSHSLESEFTADSEYDSPDLPSFDHKKEVTYESGALKCERTRL